MCRTIWARSQDKLRNYYFNHQNSEQAKHKRPRIDNDAVTGGVAVEVASNTVDTVLDVSSEGGVGVGTAAADITLAGSSVVDVAGAVSSGSTMASSSSSMSVRELRIDDITDDEKTCIINAGKTLKATNSSVTSAALFTAYCSAFPAHRPSSQPSGVACKVEVVVQKSEGR